MEEQKPHPEALEPRTHDPATDSPVLPEVDPRAHPEGAKAVPVRPRHPRVGAEPVTAGQLLPGGSGWVDASALRRDVAGNWSVDFDSPVSLIRPPEGGGARLEREESGFTVDRFHCRDDEPARPAAGRPSVPARDVTPPVPDPEPTPETGA